MAGKPGFVSVPVIPTFKGMSKEFAERLEKPAKEAGKRAGKSITDELQGAVDNLEKQVAASEKKRKQYEVDAEKAAGKRQERVEKLEAATLKLQDAEQKYQAELRKGNDGLAALSKVKSAKAGVTKATNDLRDAETDVRVAQKKAADQADDYTKTMGRLKDAQSNLADSAGKSKGAFDSIKGAMGDMLGTASDMGGPLGAAADLLSSFKGGPTAGAMAAAGALGTAAGAAVKFNDDLANSSVEIQNKLGVTGEAARDMQRQVADALRSGMGDYEGTADSVMAIQQTLADNATHMAGQTAGQLSDNFMAFANTFQVGMSEAVSTVDIMLNTGLVDNAEQGVDLLTAGFQRVPEALQGEVLDATNEYSKFFANMGIDGAAAMEMLVKASAQGQYAIDKTGDAVKEFSLKAVDPAVIETLSGYGVEVEDLAGRVARGGPEASAAMNDMVDQLMAIPDEGERATAAIAAFGTPLEDLSVDQIPTFLEGLRTTGEGLGEFEGSSQRMADNTTKTFSGMFSAMKGHIQGWAIDATLAVDEWAGHLVDSVVNSSFVQVLVDAFTSARDVIESGLSWAKDVIEAGWSAATRPFTKAYDVIVAPIGGAFREVKGTVVAAWEEITTAFKGGDWGYGALAELIGADKAEWVVNTVADVRGAFSDLWGWIQDKADQLSPIFAAIGDFLKSNLMDALAALGDTLSSLWGSVQSLAGSLVSALGSVLGSLWDSLGTVFGALVSIGKNLFEALKPIGELLLPILKVVGAVLGGVVVGAIMVFVGALKVVAEIVSWVADKFSWLMGNILGPLVEILGQVAGFIIEKLVGAFSWLAEHAVAVFSTLISWVGEFAVFIAENFWPTVSVILDALGAAFSAIWDGLSWAWENIIQPVFSGIWKLAQVTLAVIGTVILAPLLIAWNALSAGIQWAWENVIQPVWQALSDFATNVLWPAIQSVIGWIGEKWQWLSDTLSAVWGWLRDNVLVPLVSFFTDTLWPAVSSALGWVSDKWNWLYGILSSVVSWIWDNVIMRAIQGYVNLWNRAQEAIGWLVDKWNWMRDMLHAGWTWIDENVFAPLGRGLDTVKGWFQTAVDAIGRIWDGIKEKTKAPVQFVVDVVYNNGIRKAWNAVAGLVGLDKLQEIKFATGGILPGYTPGRDPYTFIEPSTGMRIGLSGGEAIMRPEATRVLGSAWVDGVNAAARVGGEAGVAEYLYGDEKKRNLGGFYSGGVIGSITDWVKKYYPMMTITSTLRNSNDYHGQGLAVDFSNGTDDTPQMQSAAMNLFTNYGKGLLELIHSPFNHNVKHGQDVGDGFGFYGAGTMNAHRNHVHVASQQPLGDPKNMVEMVWDGAKAVFRSIKERVTDLFNPIIDTVTGKLGGFNAPGVIGGLPQAFFDTVWGKAKAFILGKADEAASYSGAAGNAGNAESWREMAMAAMRRQGFNADDPAQVNAMLAQIMSESGGDPGIAQQIVDVNGTGESAGVGLLQIIPGTFAAHRDPELPDDRRDPWANMNAALRYYKSRYGTDTTTMWGHGHGYAEGGILPKLGLFDNGGWLEHGAMAVNRSGGPEPVFNPAQWKTLADVIRSVGILVPAIKAQTDVLADVADGAQEWLAKAADPKSIEGINARSGINAFLDLGLELPGQDVIKAVVDGESAIWDARDRQLGHLDAIAEKEKALADARKELEDLMKDDGGLSKDEQRKLDDAKKALEEAKANQAKADSDEKRAAAADKVADAEEKLKRVREDQADNAAENAKKREEEITKANEAVKKSETELAQARQAQAKDLDNLVLLSQDSIMGMVPVAEGLAGQLTAMGAPAAMVSQGLGAVTSALAGAASMVGPAGLSLGVVVEMLKQAIGIIKKIVGFIKEIIERVRKAQLEALKTLADGLGTIAEYAKLVAEMQQNVASLQQELVRGLMEQRTATFNLRVAVADKASAEMESAISVAKARQDLDKELEAQAKARAIRMTGLFEDWDSYLTFQADVAAGMLDKWSDTAISKLYAYESARATALKGELESRLNLIQAEDAARKAALQNVRNQQDLLIAQERLIKMSAEVSGVDLEDATGLEQIAKVMSELAEAQQALDKNTVGRWGYKLGANGQFANEYRGQLAQVDSLRNVLDTLMAETGVQIDEASLNRTLQLMGETAFRGGDTMAVLRSQLPQLAAAEEKLRTNEALKPIWDVRDDAEDMRRTVEDFTNEVELYGKTQPLEETIAGLEKAILSLDQTSEAFAEGNEGLRGDYLRAADKNASSAADLGVVWKLDSSVATPGVRGQVAKEVHIALDGESMYTADQVDKLLAEVTAGTNVRVTTRRASTVATARRNGGI